MLFQNVRADGALFIQLPEVKLRVVDGAVQITPCFVTPERELVANAMLAAGSAVAGWAAEREIPMPFVAQVPPEAEMGGGSMVEMFALRRACAPSTVQCSPGRHAGLALEPYVRVTSPLRRYADLLAHQQLRRVLKKEELLSADWLESRLVLSEAAALERRLPGICAPLVKSWARMTCWCWGTLCAIRTMCRPLPIRPGR